MKMVVTGGAGFIGSHIVAEGLKRGYEVLVLDNFHSGKRLNLQSGAELIEASLLNIQVLEKALKGAQTVFHLGALISVPESMEKQAEYFEVNTIGTVRVLEAAVRQGVSNIVLSSSAAVYGENPESPKKETFCPAPLSPYAISKLDGEYLFQMARRTHGINATALRYFNVFGPRQDPRSPYAAAVPIFIEKALKHEPIIIFGDGEQTRDFIEVSDIVQANFLAAEKGGDVFNVAWGQTITVNDLVKTIIRLTGSRSEIRYQAARPGDIKHSLADNQKIVRELGFKPSSNLEKGLSRTIEAFARG